MHDHVLCYNEVQSKCPCWMMVLHVTIVIEDQVCLFCSQEDYPLVSLATHYRPIWLVVYKDTVHKYKYNVNKYTVYKNTVYKYTER